jgi:uncharacterized damage-inducible protein DinB
MTNREFCIARRAAETPAFVRVLKAVPEENLEYKPDPKARSAAQLAWLLAAEEQTLLELIEKGEAPWSETPPPRRAAEIAAVYERSANAVNARLQQLDDAAWERKVRMTMGESSAWEDTLSEMVWGFFFDAIHHRGQLSTYLRPMGGRVPSIYGPSADDSGR